MVGKMEIFFLIQNNVKRNNMAQQTSVDFLEEKFMSIFVNDEGFKSCMNEAKKCTKQK